MVVIGAVPDRGRTCRGCTALVVLSLAVIVLVVPCAALGGSYVADPDDGESTEGQRGEKQD